MYKSFQASQNVRIQAGQWYIPVSYTHLQKETIRSLLLEIPGVKDISIEKKAGEEGWRVSLSTEENRDIREEVFYKMAEEKYPILEMQSKKVSLEEIFLELTEDGREKEESEKEESPSDQEEAENKEEENHDSNL